MIKDGVYFDLSNEDYHNDPALGSTGCKKLLASPLQYWHNSPFNTDKKSVYSSALKVGTAIHTALLEPEMFKDQFKVNRKSKTSTKVNVLGKDEFRTVNRIKKHALSSKYSNLFTNGIAEVSVFWTDEHTGIRCKTRFDYLVKGNVIVDLKSIRSLLNKDVINEIFHTDRRYYLSAGMYIEGLRQLKKMKGVTPGNEEFYFIFLSKDEPVEMEVVKVEKDVLDLGHEHFRKALDIYKESYEKWGEKEWRDIKPVLKVTGSDIPSWFNYYEEVNYAE